MASTAPSAEGATISRGAAAKTARGGPPGPARRLPGLQHDQPGTFREDEPRPIDRVRARGTLWALIVLAVVGPHGVEAGEEMNVRHLHPAGDSSLHPPVLDELGGQQDVVGSARTGGGGGERRASRAEGGGQVG